MKNRWKMMMALMGCAGVANAAFITIGNAGNGDDTTGYGGVSYEYKISATEVTIADFATVTGAGDGDEDYWNDGGGIAPGRTGGTAAPASMVSLYEAMKYCNYLTSGNVNSGYYSDAGGGVWQANALAHDAYATANGTTYFVPTEDEWYKAAYYSVSGSSYSLYADGTSDTGNPPTEGGGATGWNYDRVSSPPNYIRDTEDGSSEQNGTVNMMGNLYEWMEDPAGVIRGGSYRNTEYILRSSTPSGSAFFPSYELTHVGFRPVGVVPEPATVLLFGLGGIGAWILRRNKKTDSL